MTFTERLAQLLNEFGWDAKLNLTDAALAEQIEADLQGRVVEPEPETPPTEVESPVDTPPKPTG